MLSRFWRWYHRIGQPLEFYTALSVKACQKRLTDNTVSWQTRNPLGINPYRLQMLEDNTFLLKHRRRLSERPFIGKLESTASGTTRVRGYIVNDSAFLGFAGVIATISPIAGGLVHGVNGLLGGLFISALFIAAPIFVRYVEGKVQRKAQVYDWLQATLEAQSMVLVHRALPD